MIKNFLAGHGDRLTAQIKESLPDCFTNPFSYAPHPLCREAMEEVCRYLDTHNSFRRVQLIQEGKMFGVLVAESPRGELGYLAAYSGVLEEGVECGFFVPPVYDLTSAGSFFPAEESEINGMNDYLNDLVHDSFAEGIYERIDEIKRYHKGLIDKLQEQYLQGKARRDSLRAAGVCGEELEGLLKESQFQKAQIRRAVKRMNEELAPYENERLSHERSIAEARTRRKEMSAALQRKIFGHFSFLNARGEERSLPDIFDGVVPPAGAGECAAPRLLQYAYLHGYRPIAMGEFWYGGEKLGRRENEFYPSCKGKCGPILMHMLQGLKVDSSSFHSSYGCDPLPDNYSPQIIYEDEWILVVNKPAGILSVPGNDPREKDILQLLGNSVSGDDAPLYVVHRLDMHTSGILLIAKTEEVYKDLQMQFAGRRVEKRYVAVLDGEVKQSEGTISLPLAADYENRPLQCVDFERGKPSFSRYEVVCVASGKSFVNFWPMTGRTHQLRVHAAHPQGLNAPIEGDLLYGKLSGRLMLHAYSLRFEHPYRGTREFFAPIPPQMHPEMWMQNGSAGR